jgi:hypothetical protein
MTTGIQKKFGYEPSEILRGTNIDVVSFIGAGGSIKEEHTKLFSRIDVLVERQLVTQDQQRQLKMEVHGIPQRERY